MLVYYAHTELGLCGILVYLYYQDPFSLAGLRLAALFTLYRHTVALKSKTKIELPLIAE